MVCREGAVPWSYLGGRVILFFFWSVSWFGWLGGQSVDRFIGWLVR